MDNRENIQFRAWDTKKEVMFDVVAINMQLGRVYSSWNDENGKNLYTPMDETILMQSTGMMDDTEVLLFEGDVIIVYREGWAEGTDEYDEYLISWDDYYSGYSPFQDDYSYPQDGFIKAGNIFEDDKYKHLQKDYFDDFGKNLRDGRAKNGEWI